MASALWIDDEQFDRRHPSHLGCMSGMFHVLDYHHWNSNVKKILSHKKHESLIKHAKRNRTYHRISDDQDSFEVLKLLDDKTSHIQMDQRNQKTFSTQKRSLKSRKKAIVSENNYKDQDQDSVPSPKLHRTYSIHHLESNEWVDPIVFFPENSAESPVSSKTHVNVTNHEINDSRDILDMFEVDKELFINTLQDRSHDSVVKPILTKSGSFPTAYKSGTRILMSMKLKDKLNESCSVSKSGKIKNSNNDGISSNVIRIRRISSLNESADRYTRLSDFGVSKEASLCSSRSLKLTNGSESFLSFQQPSSLRRIHLNQDKYAELNSTQDCESLNEVMDKSDSFLQKKDSAKVDSSFSENKDSTKVDSSFSEDIDFSTKDDDFTYVKKILECSGFLKNGFEQTWYSSNQPLDPFMFQEFESQYFHDLDRFAEEVKELSHRLLIFDLVDEVLIILYERSLTYYPKKLSSFCHIGHVPIGSRILDEVWNHVRRFINLKHDMNESLNDIASRDLGSDGGWMNLLLDLECVGLDLEDLILDEVLEELVLEFI